MEYLIVILNQIVAIYINATLPEVVLLGVPAFFILWILFVNVMFIKNVLLKKYTDGWQYKVLLIVGIPLFVVAYIYDILFNITYGSVMFWSLPKEFDELDDLTITRRMKNILRTEPETWKGKRAMWICKHLVEPWDQNHCGLEDMD